jgi:hypothetical protein
MLSYLNKSSIFNKMKGLKPFTLKFALQHRGSQTLHNNSANARNIILANFSNHGVTSNLTTAKHENWLTLSFLDIVVGSNYMDYAITVADNLVNVCGLNKVMLGQVVYLSYSFINVEGITRKGELVGQALNLNNDGTTGVVLFGDMAFGTGQLLSVDASINSYKNVFIAKVPMLRIAFNGFVSILIKAINMTFLHEHKVEKIVAFHFVYNILSVVFCAALFFLIYLFDLSLNDWCGIDICMLHLSGKAFGKDDPLGKRECTRWVRFDIPSEYNSSPKNMSGLNSSAATPAAQGREAQDKSDATWVRAYSEVREAARTLPEGSKPLGRDEIDHQAALRYNDLMYPKLSAFPRVKTVREILDIESHVRQVKLNSEASKLAGHRTIVESEEMDADYCKQATESKLLHRFKLEDKARDRRLQQAADEAAVRRFDFRSYLAKDNTARHYFAGATKPSRASMHPKGTWPYDANNNYVEYKGPTKPFNIVDNDLPAKAKISFNDMDEKEDPFIHKSSPPGDEPPSDEGAPNIPEDDDNNPLAKKLIGFLLHLAPHWLDMNTFQGKFLLLLFFIIGLILTMLGIRYLYYKFIKPLFNKNSKDSNKLKRKKDNNL